MVAKENVESEAPLLPQQVYRETVRLQRTTYSVRETPPPRYSTATTVSTFTKPQVGKANCCCEFPGAGFNSAQILQQLSQI